MSSHKGIVWSVIPEKRQPTLQSVNAHLDRAIRKADAAISRVRDIERDRREAERAAFAADYTPGPWQDEPAALRDVTADYCPGPWDDAAVASPAGDLAEMPPDRWERRP